MKVLFRINDDPSSRDRRIGEVVSETGPEEARVYTIEYDGDTYERSALSCLPVTETGE